MQVTETSAEGLKREYKVVIAAQDLAAKLENQLEEMKDKVRINGFRPGKVPKAHLKRLYGRSIMGEVLQTALGDANKKIIEDNKLKLAGEPKIDFAGGEGDVAKALAALEKVRETVGFDVVQHDEGMSKVSVIGIGMRSHAGVAATAFKALADKSINIRAITTSEIKISILIDGPYTELAVRTLHSVYGLDKQ